ncbi:MAG: flavodoxin family protein [Christensenellales bacterium]
MRIGIIVHSLSGNTLAVAEKLKERLADKGHAAVIERVKVVGEENPQLTQFTLDSPPDISAYDACCFGAPVRGFSISPVIAAYLNQISSLEGKKVACFVTKTLPGAWTGGNRAIRQMKELCVAKKGSMQASSVVCWTKKDVVPRISKAVEALADMF